MTQEFAFYIDESGSPKPNPKDSASYFAVGGVLVKRQDEITIRQQVADFKQRWKIAESIPLHGNEIRSRKKKFAWLGLMSEGEQDRFFQELTNMIIQCPMLVHGCVVSRRGYLDRYLDLYGSDTWEMMKSAFSILLERVGKYVARHDGKVMVYFEKAGEKEDHLLMSYFNDLRSTGSPFNLSTSAKYDPLAANQFQQVLSGIEGKSKRNPILQVADLCLYPVAKSKERPQDRAFQALIEYEKLIDTALSSEALEQMGIKYYCFDNPSKNTKTAT